MVDRNKLWVINALLYSGCIVALTFTSFVLYYWQANEFCVNKDSKFEDLFNECSPSTEECKGKAEPKKCVSTIEVPNLVGSCVNTTGLNCNDTYIIVGDMQSITGNCGNSTVGFWNITSATCKYKIESNCRPSTDCVNTCEQNLFVGVNSTNTCAIINTTKDHSFTCICANEITIQTCNGNCLINLSCEQTCWLNETYGQNNCTRNCLRITTICNCTDNTVDRTAVRTMPAECDDKTTENASIDDLPFLLRLGLNVAVVIYFILACTLMITDATRSITSTSCARQVVNVFLAIIFLTDHFGLSIVMIAILKEQPQLYLINVLNVGVELLFLGSPLFFTRKRTTMQQSADTERTRRVCKFKCPTTKFHKSAWMGEDVCPICLSPYVENDRIKTLPCRHNFHSKCIDEWASEASTCPVCRIFVVGGYSSRRRSMDTDDINISMF